MIDSAICLCYNSDVWFIKLNAYTNNENGVLCYMNNLFKQAALVKTVALTIVSAILCTGCTRIPPSELDTPDPTSVVSVSENPTATLTDAPVMTDVPVETQTPVVTYEPITIQLEKDGLPARNTMPLDLNGISERDCEAWFADAVFVGDSVMIGWRSYNYLEQESNEDFFGQTRFLCSGSYGAGHALDPVSDKSLHPEYLGEQHLIEDSLSMIGAKKAFICFGLNDLTIYGVDGTLSNFREVISRIRQKNPDIEIYIISTMYMYKGSERDVLNNKNILALNHGLAALCQELGMEFVNIASHLIDEQGFVPDEYSSDKYVHQTNAAYSVWADVLRAVASRHIAGMPAPLFK